MILPSRNEWQVWPFSLISNKIKIEGSKRCELSMTRVMKYDDLVKSLLVLYTLLMQSFLPWNVHFLTIQWTPYWVTCCYAIIFCLFLAAFHFVTLITSYTHHPSKIELLNYRDESPGRQPHKKQQQQKLPSRCLFSSDFYFKVSFAFLYPVVSVSDGNQQPHHPKGGAVDSSVVKNVIRKKKRII